MIVNCLTPVSRRLSIAPPRHATSPSSTGWSIEGMSALPCEEWSRHGGARRRPIDGLNCCARVRRCSPNAVSPACQRPTSGRSSGNERTRALHVLLQQGGGPCRVAHRRQSRLLQGCRAILSETDSATDTLRRLITFHLDFAIPDPDVIRIQDRELAQLPPEVNRRGAEAAA